MRVLVALLSILMAPALASAQLEVCNTFRQNVAVAIVEHSKDAPTYAGAGWFGLRPGETRVLESTRLDDAKNDYLLAVVSLANGKDIIVGPTSICTAISNFNYPNYVWGQNATCRPGFVLRTYSPIPDEGFWRPLPLGTEVDRSVCKWTLTNPATHRVEGYAYFDGGSVAPNQTVTLRLAGTTGPGVSTRTGQDGSFLFPNIQSARYTLSVDSPDYASDPMVVVVQAGHDTKGLAIKLVKKH
jgi:uncharacterized membrane protein